MGGVSVGGTPKSRSCSGRVGHQIEAIVLLWNNNFNVTGSLDFVCASLM